MQDQDIQKLRDLLLPELQETIKNEVNKSHSNLSEQNIKISAQVQGVKGQVEAVKLQVEPIAKVYNALNGSGSIISWVFRNVVIPISVIIGIFLALHNLKK